MKCISKLLHDDQLVLKPLSYNYKFLLNCKQSNIKTCHDHTYNHHVHLIEPNKIYNTKRYFFRFPSLFTSKTKDYSERKILGYSMQQMFDVVADVDNYCHFVPWCIKSQTMFKKENSFKKCNLEIGFPPLIERYVSAVTMSSPHLIKSVCTEGKLFNHLIAIWKFSPGIIHRNDTCTLDFSVSFEFRSALHSNLAHLFFDEVVQKMVGAFINRAKVLYGPQASLRPNSTETHHPRSHHVLNQPSEEHSIKNDISTSLHTKKK